MLLMTLGERLRRGIEEDILAGRLLPGDLLDERALVERYRVSRTPVREALLQLSTAGLVELQPRQPARVAAIGLADLIEMNEVMGLMEAQAARLSAQRMDAARRRQLRALQEDADRFVPTRDTAGFNAANWALHQAILDGAQNGYLAAQARQLRLRLHPYRCVLIRYEGRFAAAHEQHAGLVDAIVQGDGDRAFELMRRHLALDADNLSYLVSQMPRARDLPHSA